MSETIEELREGDIYRWSYRGPNTDMRPYGSYHCCSCIAIVQHGLLRDTFWQVGASFNDGRAFDVSELSKLNLTRLGNMSELEKAPEYQSDYYDDADIVDLNHSNSSQGNFYLRKGATRSRTKMLAVARERLEQAQADECTATDRIDSVRGIIDRIESGEDVPFIPSWR